MGTDFFTEGNEANEGGMIRDFTFEISKGAARETVETVSGRMRAGHTHMNVGVNERESRRLGGGGEG
jgi:hypothetical protein